MPIRERVQQRRFPSLGAAALASLVVAANHFVQASGAICERQGITGDQYTILRMLRGVHPRGHPRGEIARHLMQRSPDVTRLLDRLARQGLVARTRGDEDGRHSIATITGSGLALLRRLDPDLDRLMQSVTAPLGPGQLRTLTRLCDALVP